MKTDFKVGDKISFYCYGELIHSEIVRSSTDRTILFLTNGRWCHTMSAIKGL